MTIINNHSKTRCIKKTNESLCLQKCESERGSTHLSISTSIKVDKSIPVTATPRSLRGKRRSQESAEPPKKRSRKPATVQISDGGEAAGIEDIQERVNILPYKRNSVLS